MDRICLEICWVAGDICGEVCGLACHPGYAEWHALMEEDMGLLYDRQDAYALLDLRSGERDARRVRLDRDFHSGSWFVAMSSALRAGYWRRDKYPTRDYTFLESVPYLPRSVRSAAVLTLARLKGYTSAAQGRVTRTQKHIFARMRCLHFSWSWLGEYAAADVRVCLDRLFHELENAGVGHLRRGGLLWRRVRGNTALAHLGSSMLGDRPGLLSARNIRTLERVLPSGCRSMLFRQGVYGFWCWWKLCRNKGRGLCETHSKMFISVLEGHGLHRDVASVVEAFVA